MAIWPYSARADLETYTPQVTYKLYARTNFPASSSWQLLPLEPGWQLNESANAASVLKLAPINELLDFSDEADRSNRMQLAGQIRLDAIINGDTERRFLGELRGLDPESVDFDIEAVDDFARWNTTSSAYYLEGTRIALTTPADLIQVTRNGYTNVYGVDTTAGGGDDEAFYEADTSNPRRRWAPSAVIVKDGSAVQLQQDVDYRLIPELGVLQVIASGVTPATIENVEVYEEGTLTIGDVVKTILQHPLTDRGFGYTSAMWQISRLTAAGSTTTTINVADGVRHWFPHHNVTISGETRRIATRDLAAGTITLATALSGAPGTGVAVLYDTLDTGIDLAQARWSHSDGTNMDWWQRTLKEVNDTLILRFNPAEGTDGVYELLRWQQPATPDYTLRNEERVTAVQPRNLDKFYTSMVGTGTMESPENLCAVATLTHVLGSAYPPHPGDPLKQYVEGLPVYYGAGFNPGAPGSDPCDAHYWTDNNPNTTMGFHDGYAYAFQELARYDFTTTRTLRRVVLVAQATQHGGAMMPGYTVEVSTDAVNWNAVSPLLDQRFLNPSQGVTVESDQISFPLARYLRVMVKPAKDGATNYDDPLLGMALIAAYEEVDYEVTAQIQGTVASPASDILVTVPYEPYELTVPTYYPDILTRLRDTQRCAPPTNLGQTLNEVKALELMYIKLADALIIYQHVSWTHVCDPYVRIGDAPLTEDAINGDVPIFVEEIGLSDAEVSVDGTNYDSGVMP